jgi:hypothetical protein
VYSKSGNTPQTIQIPAAKFKNYQKPLPTQASRSTISTRTTTKIDVGLG